MGAEALQSNRLRPCPVCGIGFAFMGNPRWSYGAMVCREACGQAASDAIDEARQTPGYRDAQQRIEEARADMLQLERRAVRRAVEIIRNRLGVA